MHPSPQPASRAWPSFWGLPGVMGSTAVCVLLPSLFSREALLFFMLARMPQVFHVDHSPDSLHSRPAHHPDVKGICVGVTTDLLVWPCSRQHGLAALLICLVAPLHADNLASVSVICNLNTWTFFTGFILLPTQPLVNSGASGRWTPRHSGNYSHKHSVFFYGPTQQSPASEREPNPCPLTPFESYFGYHSSYVQLATSVSKKMELTCCSNLFESCPGLSLTRWFTDVICSCGEK